MVRARSGVQISVPAPDFYAVGAVSRTASAKIANMKISLMIEFPDELAQEFMQMIRTFDAKHDPNHEGIVKISWLGESEMPVEKIKILMEAVDPPFDFLRVYKKN